MRAAAQAVVALAPQPSGFTAAQLTERLREQQGPKLAHYNRRQAAYDLRKLRVHAQVTGPGGYGLDP